MKRLLTYFMKSTCLFFIIFWGINMNVAAETWTITTNTGDASDTGSFGYAFGHAEDGDIIEFNIAGTDTIALNAVLSRTLDGTTITINGLNQATGNPVVIDGSKGAAGTGIYRGSGSHFPIHLNFNNLVFYKGSMANNNGGAINIGSSSNNVISNVKFDGCTFQECSAVGSGGAINAQQHANLIVENCTFIKNSATTSGGAVSFGSSTLDNDASFVNSTFYDNSAGTTGGALSSTKLVTLTPIINCTFVNNQAVTGGGAAYLDNTAGTTFVNCIAVGNSDDDVYANRNNVTLQNCMVQIKNASGTNVITDTNPVAYDDAVFNGSAAALKYNGGTAQTIAISKTGAAYQSGIATLADFDIPTTDQRGATRLDPPCIGAYEATPFTWVITNNTGDKANAASFGYAFANAADGDIIEFNIAGTDTITLDASLTRTVAGTTITIEGLNQATGKPVVIDGSQGAAGTSIYRANGSNFPVNLNFNNMVFYKGSNGSNGGAFNFGNSSHNKISNVSFNGCTFEECTTLGTGGAINAQQYIYLTFENCTFANNSASGNGGALSLGNSTLNNSAQFVNCTFYGNTSGSTGGALFTAKLGAVTQVINCTFANNKATAGGGAALGSTGTAFVNCIVAENDATDDIDGGSSVTLQNCIVQTLPETNSYTITDAVDYSDAVFAKNIVELKDNGGTTQTIAIDKKGAAFQAGIATLDGFDIPTTDQRGVARLNPPCIGAFDNPTDVVISVTGVSLNKETVSLIIDESDAEQLTETVNPTDATNKNVSWSSSDESIATVSDAGLVTAIGEGTATITVTTEDGGFTATCTVTVTTPTGIPQLRVEAGVYLANGQLYVNSPVAETIKVYSTSGVLLYNFQKPAGKASYSINMPVSILIIKGSSGWVKKN